MKRTLSFTLAVFLMLTLFSGCMAPPSSALGDHGPLQQPTFPAAADLQIGSIDQLNYYAAICVLSGPQKLRAPRGNYSISLLTDSKEEPPVPDYTGPILLPDDAPIPQFTQPEEKIYYYELDPNAPFSVSKVSMFQIELTDKQGFLASKLGLGVADVVITEECIGGETLITFRSGDNFYSCLSNGWSWDRNTKGTQWDFSTHKYVDGFCIVKNFEQENFSFCIDMDAEGQATAFECRQGYNSILPADQNIRIFSATVISTDGGSYTIAELEAYFNGDSQL